MRIHLLGPVRLTDRERRPHLGSDKSRLVLASLALDVGRPVPLDVLVQRLWEDDLPFSPRENIHTYVSRIRRAIRAAQPGPGAPVITQHAHTYTLQADRDSVDWHRYRRLTSWAKEVSRSGDDIRAIAQIREAERLWEGTALAGLPGEWPELVRVEMEAHHRSVTASRVAMELRREQYGELAGELAALVEKHPADETLIGQLMIACYGCGRHSDALRVYQRARETLRAEFGADVGEELVHIHQHILRRAPIRQLTHTEAEISTESGAGPPDNLPRHVPLVGRHSEMQKLRSVIARSGNIGSVITVESISGMAGVGKSSLAVHAAHELREYFPDGRLYLDLRTHSRPQQPLSTEAALAALLRLLGVPAHDIPPDAGERAALWHAKLADRRVLVVLDDAADPSQVRPLLPGASPSLTLVTSRRRLTGLPGARALALDVLPPEDAIALFRRFADETGGREEAGNPEEGTSPHPPGDLAGQERREEIPRIVHLCGYLPLAIEIAANRLTSRPSWSLAALSERLARSPGRLAEIRDGYDEIAAAFEVSYQALSTDQQFAFRMLSLHTGPEFGPHAAAALLARSLDQTERFLEGLLTCHLIQEPAPHRFRYHDLLGEYARTLSGSTEDEAQRDEALARLVDFYIRAADRCDRLLYPPRIRMDVAAEVGPSSLPLPVGDQPGAARRWFTVEMSNLVAAEQYARDHGMPDRAALLTHVLAGHLDAESHWTEAGRLHKHAVDHWQRTGHGAALCRALLDLSAAHSSTARYASAEEAVRRALDIARTSGDVPAEVEALRILGVLHWRIGENRTALAFHEEALTLCTALKDSWTEARCRNNTAIALLYLGEHESALRNFEESLSGFHSAGDLRNYGKTLNNLGDLYLHTGKEDSARRAYEESLRIAESTGSRADAAIAQANIAEVLVSLGDSRAGKKMYGIALQDFRRLRDRKNEAAVLGGLGRAHLSTQDVDSALEYAHQSLALARTIGAADEETRALCLLGEAELARGRPEAAVTHLTSAIASARRTSASAELARAEAALTEARRRTHRTD